LEAIEKDYVRNNTKLCRASRRQGSRRITIESWGETLTVRTHA